VAGSQRPDAALDARPTLLEPAAAAQVVVRGLAFGPGRQALQPGQGRCGAFAGPWSGAPGLGLP